MTAEGPHPARREASQELVNIECELARMRAMRLSREATTMSWMRIVSVLLSAALLLAGAAGMWLLNAQENGRLHPAKAQPAAGHR